MHIRKELHDILGRIGQKHRYPMEFVHVIGGIMICFIVVPPCFDSTQYTNKNVEVWKSGERLKSNNSVTYAHLIKMPFAAKKLD